MRRLAATLASCVAGFLIAPALATTLTGSHPRLHGLQHQLDSSWLPTPSGSVEVFQRPCPEIPETSCARPGRIDLHPDSDRWAFWHEVGHILDAHDLTDADRERFTELIGRPGAGWREPDSSGLEHSSPGECFASGYAALATGKWLFSEYFACLPLLRRQQVRFALDLLDGNVRALPFRRATRCSRPTPCARQTGPNAPANHLRRFRRAKPRPFATNRHKRGAGRGSRFPRAGVASSVERQRKERN